MSPAVSEQTLFEGAWWALEQAGRLMHAAVLVFDNGDCATGVALAMLGREELGRCRMLAKLGKAAHEGQITTREQLKKTLKVHTEKQRHGAISVMVHFPPGTAQAIIDAALEAERTALPDRRHQARMSATYVDLPASGTAWERPSQIDASQAVMLWRKP